MKIEMVNSEKRLRRLVIGHVVVLSFSFLLINSFHVGAQTSPLIDCNLTTLSAGYMHTVGLKEDGTVVAVGYNEYGQLNVTDWTNIKSISAGGYHTVGLKEDGTVVAVGYNGDGELNVSGWTNIKSISAGAIHTVGLKEDGTVVAVGYNYYGQLDVSGWTNIKSISAGEYHTVGLKEDGTVVAVGYNAYGKLDVSGWTNIKSISAGEYHTVGLKEDGTVVAVGYNGDGELNVSGWTNIKSISAGGYHTVGLKEDGTVVAVGYNYYGQLDVSGWTNIRQPLGAQTSPLIDCNLTTLSAGGYHTVGLKEDGTVVAVGYNYYGQLDVSGWTNIKSISAGLYHTVGLKEDGTVVAVGWNGYGQLDVSGWTNIKSISAGLYHTVGLKEDGTVVAVGYNGDGQLNVSGWTNIKSISAGLYHTVGLKEDGTVVAVGYNAYGKLDVSGWTNIKSISAGVYHTVGLKEDGTVVALGYIFYGQFDVSGWTNIKSISAGYGHTVGLKEDGTVVAVGWNYYGQMNVSGWTNIKSISAGLYHTVGLKEDGTVVAVGWNYYGQLNVSGWTNIRQPCNTQPGTNVSVTPDPNVTISFNEVTGAGNTTVTVSNTNPGSEKTGFKFLGTYYDISTTASYIGPVTVCLKYDDSNIPAGREERLKIFHWQGTDWMDVTFSLDTANNIICAQVSSLSWFAAAYELDSIAPTTKISLSGTLGNNGWYVSNVQVALTATDNEGGSGVAKTEYSFDGITWNTYTAPFMVSTEGTTTVYYRSTDNAGNVEETKTEAIKIDKTLPSITITSPQAKDYLHSENVTLNFSATDALSGIDAITGLLDSTPATNGQVIDLRTLTLGQHTLAVTAVDKAGNSASKTVTFNVKPVPATVDVKPDTLNRASQSDKNAVTVYIEVPGYDVNAMDVATVTLSTSKGSVSAQLKPTEVGDYDKDGVPDRMVKFDRQAVIAIIDVGEKVKITISGKIAGAIFEGSDEIRVIE